MRNTWNSLLFDPFRVELVCASVTPGCTRGYSHLCPSGTVRCSVGFLTRERNPKPEGDAKPPNVYLFSAATAPANGARPLRRFRVALTRGSYANARRLRTVRRPQGRAPEHILAVGALDTYPNDLGGPGFGIRISLGIRHTVFGIHP